MTSYGQLTLSHLIGYYILIKAVLGGLLFLWLVYFR